MATIPVLDGHNDLPWALRERGYDHDRFDVAGPVPELHTDLPRASAGGLRGQFWSVYVRDDLGPDEAVRATLEQIDCVRELARRHPGRIRLVADAEELTASLESGADVVASLLGAEGGHSINGSLAVLRTFRDLGVRYLTLTHNHHNDLADSGTDEPRHGGLSELGRQVVAEMNRIGMIVDLSHVAVTTMHDALDVTRAPVLFSHSGARAVTDHPRNVPDDVLQRLPGNGGVCMATFVPAFVNQATADHRRAELPGPAPRAGVADVVAHLEHLREVVGIDHVGLGGDFDGVSTLPDDLDGVDAYPRLLTALAERGWSTEDLTRLGWRNATRVLRDVEAVAASSDSTTGS